MIEKCKFCQVFWDIPRKYWQTTKAPNGKTLLTLRQCPKTKEIVSTDDGCKKLELTNYIRCKKWQEQIPTEACIHRQKTKRCRGCRQGQELLKLFRLLYPPKREPIKKKGAKNVKNRHQRIQKRH